MNRDHTATELIDFALDRIAEIKAEEDRLSEDYERISEGYERIEDIIMLLEHAKIAEMR
jgi:hypothetical protein